jgi:aminoglycoside N3'-acetyltransferase
MITKKDFIESLNQVINKNDKVIVIYSGISSFLNKFPYQKNLTSEILTFIENFITKDRILILPSFSANNFLKTGKFDIKNSIDNIGVLPKEALKRNYFRTPQPLHSYLVLGKNIKFIKNLSYRTSWGEGSILDFMAKNDARICTLGLPWNKGCAYLHKFEEDYQVPWRYFKKFRGKMYRGSKFISKCEETKYSLPKMNGELYNYQPFIKYIKKAKSYKKNLHKDFTIESAKTSCLDEIGKKIFLKNSWCIIKKKKELLNWIKNKKINNVILNK